MSGCTQCGSAVEDDTACEAVFHELGTRFQQDALLMPLRTQFVDAYCCQHEPYIRSAKSFAAHLVGLCLAIEFGQSGPAASIRISRWLDGRGPHELAKPPGPIPRASMNIDRLAQAGSSAEVEFLVRQLARAVWDAWKSQHEIARRWASAIHNAR
jgi:hypothetical protein